MTKIEIPHKIRTMHYIDEESIEKIRNIVKNYRYAPIDMHFKRMIDSFWNTHHLITGIKFGYELDRARDVYNDIGIFCNYVMLKTLNEQWIGNLNALIAGDQKDKVQEILDSLNIHGLNLLNFIEYTHTLYSQEYNTTWWKKLYGEK